MSAFYAEVLRLLSSPPLNQHFDKSWTAHVQVKETLYDVESQLQQAAQLHKDDDIAPEIARLKVIQLPQEPAEPAVSLGHLVSDISHKQDACQLH